MSEQVSNDNILFITDDNAIIFDDNFGLLRHFHVLLRHVRPSLLSPHVTIGYNDISWWRCICSSVISGAHSYTAVIFIQRSLFQRLLVD
jgi:hypothetical protein